MKIFSITMLGTMLFSYPVLAQDVCGVPVQLDNDRVKAFMDEYKSNTWKRSSDNRRQELDDRIRRNAKLSLADKIEAVRQLGGGATSSSEDLRIAQIFLSVDPKELSLFKFILEYDGDYKDVAEYLFDDIDNKEIRDDVLAHFQKTGKANGIKVLSDVDDTMYANLIEKRYPKKTVYPGVLEFYGALKQEPFELKKTPLTTLSARPNSHGGYIEEISLKKLMQAREGSLKELEESKENDCEKIMKGRLCPSALSGEIVSSAIGTLETKLSKSEILAVLSGNIPHGQEDNIGKVKFENFKMFSQCYPEYHYVFVGDSGQADAIAAQLMMTSASGKGVITTFIHDLRQDKTDKKSVSSTFKALENDIIVTKKSNSGRGVIVFRNYIQAAAIAYKHSATLDGLITADELVNITQAALNQFQLIKFNERDSFKKTLQEQYRIDAEDACALLEKTGSHGGDVEKIRNLLNEKFK